MSVRVVPVVAVSCDWLDCNAAESITPPPNAGVSWVHAAARLARAAGWTVSNANRRSTKKRTARCPEHRKQRMPEQT